MDFKLTEEQMAVRDAARDFAQNMCKPGVIERDTNQQVPMEQLKQLGELGFMGMMVDQNMEEVGWTRFLTFWLWKKSQK